MQRQRHQHQQCAGGHNRIQLPERGTGGVGGQRRVIGCFVGRVTLAAGESRAYGRRREQARAKSRKKKAKRSKNTKSLVCSNPSTRVTWWLKLRLQTLAVAIRRASRPQAARKVKSSGCVPGLTITSIWTCMRCLWPTMSSSGRSTIGPRRYHNTTLRDCNFGSQQAPCNLFCIALLTCLVPCGHSR
ncbi:uncharacterized protein BKA78DRAFT_109433 [Phyllosticta capitalensis]|uniref:uncharacterized protein n=1 Tax=Phyllosticta capitalensis TaxID=121624 RepID=UPI00312D5CB3